MAAIPNTRLLLSSLLAMATLANPLLAETDSSATAAAPPPHFHPLGKPPSQHTLERLQAARNKLPFDDDRDFEEASRGFIAAPESGKILGSEGKVVWDMDRYQFLLDTESLESVHPSMHRQSKLTMKYGLFEVADGFYQVRGYDLANMTFVRGNTGWIIFDTLTTAETAAAAKALVDQHLGELPVVAVVYSHSHGDHFGGVRGIVSQEDVTSGRVQIIAPRGFMEHAISENVYAGNAMTRRLAYQYGILLPASPYGHAGQGLGQNIARGSTGLIQPTKTIDKEVETLTIDGVTVEFMNTPGAEAPAEMHSWFPDKRIFWGAENVTATFHNIYTLRGALVRDALTWSKYLNKALYLYGNDAEVMIASHHWPRWGNARIQEVLRGQRDLYANINNQALNLANQGVTVNQIHNVYETPPAIARQWYNRGYHGSPEHNSRGVINRYLGYWDSNPATLIPLSPEESAPLYTEMMGGAERILSKAEELNAEGRYRASTEILNRLVFAEPDNRAAREMLADAYEQLGYQQENPGLRNSFLNGALELRSGLPAGAAPNTASADVVRAMSTELFFDYLAIRLDSRKVGDAKFRMNFVTPDTNEQFVVELSNATLTTISGFQASDADVTISVNRVDFERVMMQQTTLRDLISSGIAKTEGDPQVLAPLLTNMTTFTSDFEVLPGTAPEK